MTKRTKIKCLHGILLESFGPMQLHAAALRVLDKAAVNVHN